MAANFSRKAPLSSSAPNTTNTISKKSSSKSLARSPTRRLNHHGFSRHRRRLSQGTHRVAPRPPHSHFHGPRPSARFSYFDFRHDFAFHHSDWQRQKRSSQ